MRLKMTVRNAQLFTVVFALIALFFVMCVFSTGRLWGFPLNYATDEEEVLLQLIYPTFFSILGNAVFYIISRRRHIEKQADPLIIVLIVGPSAIFMLCFILITTTFYISNQSGSTTYFKLDDYRSYLSILLGLIGLTVTSISAYIFSESWINEM